MKVLLTGGAGFIGSHTCVELIESGHEVAIVDNFSNSKPEVLNRIARITGKDPVFFEADVTDKSEMRYIFDNNNFDAVIHFAGFKAVGESVAKPLMYYRNNLDSTITLIEVMQEYGVNNVVFSSSATVYGESNKPPYNENMPTSTCTNPYGTTKLISEQIFTDATVANKDLSVVLLRYFNPIGANPSGLIGEDPAGIPNNLFPYVAKVAGGKLEKLGIFGNDYPTPDGTGIRDYIHVVDLAKGHVKALEYAVAHKGVEAINLGSGKGHSVFEVVQTFMKVNDVAVPYEIKPRRAGDLAESYANAEKAERLLGWKAELSLEDMCRDMWRWQTQNPNGYDTKNQ